MVTLYVTLPLKPDEHGSKLFAASKSVLKVAPKAQVRLRPT